MRSWNLESSWALVKNSGYFGVLGATRYDSAGCRGVCTGDCEGWEWPYSRAWWCTLIRLSVLKYCHGSSCMFEARWSSMPGSSPISSWRTCVSLGFACFRYGRKALTTYRDSDASSTGNNFSCKNKIVISCCIGVNVAPDGGNPDINAKISDTYLSDNSSKPAFLV